MPKASVTRLIERDKDKLINFVLDIEKYPDFIPFCIDSKVYDKKENDDGINIIADLTIGKRPFVDTYKSDVKFMKNQDLIHVTNIDGPLNYLENKFIITSSFVIPIHLRIISPMCFDNFVMQTTHWLNIYLN